MWPSRGGSSDPFCAQQGPQPLEGNIGQSSRGSITQACIHSFYLLHDSTWDIPCLVVHGFRVPRCISSIAF